MIPFFNYQALYNKDKKNILKVFDSVCSKGAFILQDELKQFEKNAAKFIKAKYLIGVANGTDALILGLKAAGIKKGDEIIIPSHTYIATAAAIKLVGATPILTECKDDSMMDENDIEHRITKKTKAIMAVQLNGRCCTMDKIIKIANKYKILMFEDAAQGFGAKFKNKYAGNFGLFGTISFYPAKLIGCFGDGGAVVTNNKAFAKKCMKNEITFVQLLSPTTSKQRMKQIIKDSHNMIYYISQSSTTGGKLKVSPQKILKEYKKIKYHNKSKNVVIGFGITEKTISSLKKADGLVVGSAICKEITKSIKKRQNIVTNVTNVVRRLKNKIK